MRNMLAMIGILIGLFLAVAAHSAYWSLAGLGLMTTFILFGFKKEKGKSDMLKCPATGNWVIDPKSNTCSSCSMRFYGIYGEGGVE